MEKTQEIYLFMDDSGKMSNHEICCCYGGIIFLDKKAKDKFITQYRQIIGQIKCSECLKYNFLCDNLCPEIKNSRIKKESNRRRILNYLKKQQMFCLIIANKKVRSYIMESKSSKGRYLDYAQKLLIKKIFINLINTGKLNPKLPTKLIMYIDEQATRSNGYYNLKESIKEEFIHGISNYNYGVKRKAILENNFEIVIHYVDSKHNYAVQAADFAAGKSRYLYLKWLANPQKQLDEILDNYTFIKLLP